MWSISSIKNKNKDKAIEDEAFRREMGGIPSDEELKRMSDFNLLHGAVSCEKGSAKLKFFNGEIERRKIEAQTKRDRKNVVIGVVIGGSFTLLGGLLSTVTSCQTAHQITKCNPHQKQEDTTLYKDKTFINLVAPIIPAANPGKVHHSTESVRKIKPNENPSN